MNVIGKLICFVTRKHKRMRRAHRTSVELESNTVRFYCARCGHTETRKAKAAA